MDISQILSALTHTGDKQSKLFALARDARQRKYGNKVFIRGVLEISNACNNNCVYCGMRHDNLKLPRYQMYPQEILDTASLIKDSGINILLLQSGENNFTTEVVAQVIPIIKHEINMDVILCLGNRPRQQLAILREAGADGYILKHETTCSTLHFRLRGTGLSGRLRCIENLLQLGFCVGGGNIVGLPGQTLESIAEDALFAKRLRVNYISASPFIPHQDSPLRNSPIASGDLALNTMALMRLILNVPIPSVSVLDLVCDDGQFRGFLAGANVITVNFTPHKYRRHYSLYSYKRPDKTLEEIFRIIDKAGLYHDPEGYVEKDEQEAYHAADLLNEIGLVMA